MDVNGDGQIDILSGSYSRESEDMAGLFQVLYGTKEGRFRKAVPLEGSDGRPLVLPAGSDDEAVVLKICTRPFACDLDGDGKLDIVSGNFRGTFGLFRGEGGGRFAPLATWLEAGGGPMAVESHGDPFLVDWDGDGDLDLLSGSARGGVFLFVNGGSRTAPDFRAPTALVEPPGNEAGEADSGDAWYVGPHTETRVWAADVDGDGKLDLLVGDSVTFRFPAPGVDEATVRAKDAAWKERMAALVQSQPGDGDAARQEQWQEEFTKLLDERETFLREDPTGFVWLFRRK